MRMWREREVSAPCGPSATFARSQEPHSIHTSVYTGLSPTPPEVLGWRATSQREAHHGDPQRDPGPAAGEGRPGREAVHGRGDRDRVRGDDRHPVAEPR